MWEGDGLRNMLRMFLAMKTAPRRASRLVGWIWNREQKSESAKKYRIGNGVRNMLWG